jgi:DNA ligase (NAD+)
MNKIHEYLQLASRNYYAGVPIISDEVFDKLAESSGFNEVGAKQHEHLEKHYFPMYSLQKYYEDEGKESPLKGEKDIDASPKLDGAAVSHLYIEGKLVRSLTRGDGTEGTNVTDKFLATSLIPHTIPCEGVVQITGELVAPKLIENARNYAAGALNLKDTEEFKSRTVAFIAYGVQLTPTNTFREDMAVLKSWGFETVKDKDLHNIFDCDGVVYRLNSHEAFYGRGFTSKYPLGMYALKERQACVETKLLDVVWQVGKSGRITPVAILEPVKIEDAVISRATLNNYAFIEALDIRIGDIVAVRRAGMIIPEICYKVGG